MFEFFFVAIGQGDCCLVRCPNGQIVVVDCGRTSKGMGELGDNGNTAWFDEACALLRDWAGTGSGKVDAFIMTHPHEDHYNQAHALFGKRTLEKGFVFLSNENELLDDLELSALTVSTIYFSNALDGPNPLGNYTSSDLLYYAKTWETDKIHEVTINNLDEIGSNRCKTWNKDGTQTESAISDASQPVLEGTMSGGTDWSIKIIAGNVYGEERTDGTVDKNAGSLITMFQIGNNKAVLTGDATLNTGEFLLAKHGVLLKEVDLCQVPHHGSNNAFSKTFVEHLNPTRAVVSVGFLERKYHLPRYEALEDWLDDSSRLTKVDEHGIDYWLAEDPDKDQYNWWQEYWNNKGMELIENGSFKTLKTPVETNTVIGVDYNNNADYLLHRETIDIDLVMTSQKSQYFTLSEDGIS